MPADSRSNGQIVSDVPPFHLEQYKMLREEVMQHVREIYRTEVLGATAVGVIYTWLLLHKQDITTRAIWFIAPCIVVLCALRCGELVLRIEGIARYLRLIEEIAFAHDSQLPGWERYISKGAHRSISLALNITATAIWFLALCGSIVASWYFSK